MVHLVLWNAVADDRVDELQLERADADERALGAVPLVL
jgi:hypothetical protein